MGLDFKQDARSSQGEIVGLDLKQDAPSSRGEIVGIDLNKTLDYSVEKYRDQT